MPPKKAPEAQKPQKLSLAEFQALPNEPKPTPKLSKNQERKQKRLEENKAAISRARFWNKPIPPVPGRKTRKRGGTGMNDWPYERWVKYGTRCSFCKEPAYVGAIRRKSFGLNGEKIGPIVRFPAERVRSVIFALFLLRRNIGHYDVIFMIMRMAFEPEVFEQQLIQSEQVHTPCGCRYHRRCYEELCKIQHRRCNEHDRII
jgi:hypothetical protein